MVGWDAVRVLQIESNGRHGKYKESVYMACSAHLISQPSLGIPFVWIHLESQEVTSL